MKLMLQLDLGPLQPRPLRLWQGLAGAVDVKGQHRERRAIGAALRRELCCAERLSEAAIFFGLVSLKTPCFRSSASLSLVTRRDQRFGDELAFRAVVLRAALRAVLRVADLRALAVFRRSAMTDS